MSRLIFDIETDGLLPDLTCIHSLCIKDADTGKSWSLHHDTIEGGLETLMRAGQIIGHNIIKFDLPAIKKVYPWFHIEEGKVLDTLVCSRLIWPDIKENDFRFLKHHQDFPKNQIGRHGLEAWGRRMGLHKGDYAKEMKARGLDPWAAWNPEMQAYCEQDVEVTHALLKKIEGKNPSQQAVKLEHDFQWVLWRQEQHGFPFDKHKAEQLLSKLLQRRAMLEDELRDAFPPWEVRTPFIPKVNNAKRGYVKGQLTYKTKQIVFNPGSRDHIANRLMTVRGWKPTEKTTSGKPKVDESVLSKLPYPEAKLLSEYLLVQKRLGQLAEGRNSWLNMVREDGRIHGEVITNGAVTGRCTHRNPNIAQVPSVKVGPDGPLKGPEGLWGYDCRELFHAPPGFVLVGADASGLELRCLAHFMGKHDGGDYAKVLLEGDIHTVNQQAAGLPTRNDAKTFIYAFLYGAGDVKIGSIVAPTAPVEIQATTGKRLKATFLKKTPALKRLKKAVELAVKNKGSLIGLDGRILPIRSAHAALNTLLQSAGALVVKQATIFFYEECSTRGYEFGKDYALVAHVHDELQSIAREEIAEEIGRIKVECIRKAGEHFNFRCPLDGEYKIGRNWAETH